MRALAAALALVVALPAVAGDGRGKAKDQLAREIKGRTFRLRVDVLSWAPWDARIATTASTSGVEYPNRDQPLQFPADSDVEVDSLWGWDRGIRISIKRAGYKPRLFASAMAGVDPAAKDAEMRTYMSYVNLQGDTLEDFRAALAKVFYLDGSSALPSPRGNGAATAAAATPAASSIDLEGYGATRWGMSRDEVKAAVAGLAEVKDALAAEVTVAGLPALAIYRFTGEGNLREVTIGFGAKHTNKTDHLTDFGRVKEGLTTKYGQPTKDDTLWKNDLYRKDPSEWGMAVATGHLIKSAQWELPTTAILLVISGDNFQIKHTLYYASQALKDEGAAAAKAKALDGL